MPSADLTTEINMTDIQNIEKTELPDNWRAELRALLLLGIPMGLTQVAQFFVFFVDVLMIGRLGPTDLAAASLGTVYFFALWMLGAGPAMAVTPLVSQALGANKNDRKDARRSVRMALWMIIAMTPLVVMICAVSENISLFFNQDPIVAAKAADYALILGLCWPFSVAVMALRCLLASIGKTSVPFFLAMATTAINISMNYIFIFGNFGAPKLGLVGAGVASLIASIAGLALFIAYIGWDRHAREFDVFGHFWRADWPRFAEVNRLGWPISITTFFEGMLFNAAVFLAGTIGIAVQAAYQIGLNVASLAFMMPFGIAMAGGVRIGLAAGAQNQAAMKRASLTSIAACVVAIGVSAIPIALYPGLVANIYLDVSDPINAEVIAFVISFLPVAAAFMLFDAVQVAANQMLRALKDVRAAMIITGISFWVLGFPVSYILGLHTPVGALGIWYGLLVSLIAASILLGGRLYVLVWKRGPDLALPSAPVIPAEN